MVKKIFDRGQSNTYWLLYYLVWSRPWRWKRGLLRQQTNKKVKQRMPKKAESANETEEVARRLQEAFYASASMNANWGVITSCINCTTWFHVTVFTIVTRLFSKLHILYNKGDSRFIPEGVIRACWYIPIVSWIWVPHVLTPVARQNETDLQPLQIKGSRSVVTLWDVTSYFLATSSNSSMKVVR